MRQFQFRGVAGETVRHFINYSTLAAGFATFLAMLVATLLVGFIVEKISLPSIFAVPLIFIALAPIIGRFSIAAKNGDLAAGLLSSDSGGELLPFWGRAAVLFLAWQIPYSLIVMLLGKNIFSLEVILAATSNVLLAILFFLIGVALLAFGLLAIFLTIIVCTKAQSIQELFKPPLWKWILIERRDDLGAFLACWLGGVLIFMLLITPPIVVIMMLLIKIKPAMAMYSTMIINGSAMAGVPILLGRLAGAFIAVEMFEDDQQLTTCLGGGFAQPAKAASPPSAIPPAEKVSAPTAPTAKSNEAPSNAREVVNLGPRLAVIEKRAAEDLAAAITEAEELVTANSGHLGPAVLLCNLYTRANRFAEAIALANKAIPQACDAGAGQEAVEIFKAVFAHRQDLRLEGADYLRLSKALSGVKRFDEAMWTCRAAEATGGNKEEIERGFVSVADAAMHAGELDKAIAYWQFFVNRYPLSAFHDYGSGELKRLERKKA